MEHELGSKFWDNWENAALSELFAFLKLICLFYLGTNYFTILWWFFPYIDINQSWVYMSPIMNPSLFSFPIPSLWVVPVHWPWVPCFMHQTWDWSSTSHMVIYMFQWYSLSSSQPRLLPQSPKVCSLYLCLFCCLIYRVVVTVVHSPSCVWLFATPWTAACQACLSFTISWSLPKFISIALMMPSSHLIISTKMSHLSVIPASLNVNFWAMSQ